MDNRLSKRPRNLQEEDWISDLPNALIYQIFSFLSTADVVRTTVLSSRWNRLWTTVTAIDFNSDDSSLNKRQHDSFIDFVTNFFFLREAVDIRKLSLIVPWTKWSDIKKWLTVAARRNVVDLELWTTDDLPLAFPSCLFSCKSLQRLSLGSPDNGSTLELQIPDTLCFPSLKFLHVVVYEDVDFETTAKLLSTCPALQELKLEGHLEGQPNLEFTISSPTLTRLVIDITMDTSCILEFEGCSFSISIPNLKYLTVRANIAADYLVQCPSFIERVSLRVAYRNDTFYPAEKFFTNLMNNDLFPDSTHRLISAVSKVQYLTLSGDIMRILLSGSKKGFPSFCNLTHLDIGLPGALGLTILPHFLRNSAKLKFLVLWKEEICEANLEKDVELTASAIDFLLDHHPLLQLEKVDIKAFEGEDYEQGVIKYLLKNAQALKKLTIWCGTLLIQKDTFRKHVLSFPTASATCVIEFR